MKYIILIAFLIIAGPVLSEDSVYWSNLEPSVGENVSLTLETENGLQEILSPEIGLYSESNELPFMEIVSRNKDGNKILFKMRFTKSGEQKFKVIWKNDAGEKEEKLVSVSIKSLLGNEDKEPLDITEPLEFSGPYILRLLLMVLGFTMLVGGLYYLFLRQKKRQRVPPEAGFQSSVDAETIEPFDAKLELLLKNENMLHKDFVYALSEYLKSALSEKLDSNTTYMTQSELEEILMSKLRLTERVVQEFSLYLNSIKYMPNDETIHVSKAKSIREYWERILGI